MQRFIPTRSPATGVMAVLVDLFVGMIVTMPVTHIHANSVFYAALIVIGIGMLLRERIFPPARAQAVASAPAFADVAPVHVAAPVHTAELGHLPAFELVG